MARRGENIYKRKDGRWEARIPNGFYPNGKRKYRSLYAHSYNEVKQMQQLYLTQKELISGASNIRVVDLSEQWLRKIKISTKESTYYCYQGLIQRHILPDLGGISLKQLNTETMDQFISNKLNHGRLDGKGGLSAKTVRDILCILKAMISYANTELQYPQDAVSIHQPKFTQKEIQILDHHQQQQLEDFLKKEQNLFSHGILLCLYCGLRLGEICALQWSSIYLPEQILSVNKTIVRTKNTTSSKPKTRIIFTEPKTKHSIRTIPIPTFLNKTLEKYTAKGSKESAIFFLTGESKQYVDPRTYQNYFKRCLEKCEIPIMNFHVLRHTFASRAIESGMDPKMLSEILGHSNVTTTLNRYVHTSPMQKQLQIEQLATFMQKSQIAK